MDKNLGRKISPRPSTCTPKSLRLFGDPVPKRGNSSLWQREVRWDFINQCCNRIPLERNLAAVFISVFFLLLLSATSFAMDVKREVLPNGLVLLYSEKHNLPLVMVDLTVKAGPLDEPADKAGLAYLTSALLTEGTKTMTSAGISNQVDFIGADLEASTSDDFTTVSLSVLKKDLDKGFRIFSDCVLDPVFDPREIARVKAQTKDSLKQAEDDPEFVARKAFKKAVYGPFPYGRLVQGSPQTLDAITRNDLVKFHDRFYVPANSILTVVGDITPAELKALLNKYFGNWQGRPFPAMASPRGPQEPKPQAWFINKEITQATILYGNLGIRRDNPDFYAASVMNYILGGGGFASRLMADIRDKLGLAYDVHSYFTTDKHKGIFEIGVQTKNRSAKEVIDLVDRDIEQIRSRPVTAQELKDAKAYLTGSFPRKLDTMRKIADFLSQVEFYDLGPDFIDKYPGYINRVTADDVLRAARKYITPDKRVLVVVGNQSETGLKLTPLYPPLN